MNYDSRKKIVDTCFLIINDQIDFIEGCRKLVSLRNQFGLMEDEDFLPIVGVVSETDDYPEKNVRQHFSKDYLKRVDKEVSNYVSIVRPSIIDVCNLLVRKYE